MSEGRICVTVIVRQGELLLDEQVEMERLYRVLCLGVL